MNKEKEWFALMNEEGNFFDREGSQFVISFKRTGIVHFTQWESSPLLRNETATKIYLTQMQKKHGGTIVRFVIQEK